MADVTLTYKGQNILELSASGNKTIQTAGKYCEGDINLAYVRPGEEPSLPNEYQQVEYVISNGSQYTTPFLYSSKVGDYIFIRFSRMNGNSEQAAFGTHPNSSLGTGTIEIGIASGSESSGTSVWGPCSVSRNYEQGGTGSVNSAAIVVNENCTNEYLTLFKYKNYMLNGRIYHCKIYNFIYPQDVYGKPEYTLAFYAIPCYRKSDGVIGMYEAVSGTFLTNSGSGNFEKGPDVN